MLKERAEAEMKEGGSRGKKKGSLSFDWPSVAGGAKLSLETLKLWRRVDLREREREREREKKKIALFGMD